MSSRWSHVAMLLLGVSVTVGFYEGRRLVQDTVQALSAVTSTSSDAEADAMTRTAGLTAPGAAASFDAPDVPAATGTDTRTRAERRRHRAERASTGPALPADEVPASVDDLRLAVDPAMLLDANRIDVKSLRKRARMVRRSGQGPREAGDLRPLAAPIRSGGGEPTLAPTEP